MKKLDLCDGYGCPLRDVCQRYKAGLDKLKENHLDPTPVKFDSRGQAKCAFLIEKLIRKDEDSTQN